MHRFVAKVGVAVVVPKSVTKNSFKGGVTKLVTNGATKIVTKVVTKVVTNGVTKVVTKVVPDGLTKVIAKASFAGGITKADAAAPRGFVFRVFRC